ncbi:MAG: STN domain-containing protein [Pararobbsia sp.]
MRSFMTGIQASARVRWLVAYVLLGSVFTILHAHAQGAVTQSDASAGVIRFDLPAQPLATALLVFGSAAGMLVGVKSSLLDGRTSAPVHGNYSPREALQCLLAGTGLEANFPSEDEAIIVPASLTQQPAPPSAAGGDR